MDPAIFVSIDSRYFSDCQFVLFVLKSNFYSGKKNIDQISIFYCFESSVVSIFDESLIFGFSILSLLRFSNFYGYVY